MLHISAICCQFNSFKQPIGANKNHHGGVKRSTSYADLPVDSLTGRRRQVNGWPTRPKRGNIYMLYGKRRGLFKFHTQIPRLHPTT